MIGLALLIFGTILAITLVGFGLGAHFLENQSKKRLVTALEPPSEEKPAPETAVLVQHDIEVPSVIAWLGRYRVTGRIADRIQQAGLDWTPNRLLGLMGVFAAVGALIGWKARVLLGAAPSMAAVAAIFAFLPWLHLERKRKSRLAAFEKQFPEALDFLSRAMRAGHAFTVSLEMLAQESPEPLRSEFRRVYNEHNLGESVPVVLSHFADRVPLLDVRFFVAAVLMQREAGGNLSEILTKLAQVIRERFRLKGTVRAVSAHGRMTAAVLSILPVAVGFLMTAASPKYMAGFAAQKEGKIMLVGALIAQAIGYYIMKRIVNIKV